MINRKMIFPLTLVFLLGFIYYFSDITMPFIIAGVLAYIFQPIVSHMERYYIPRSLGALIVTIVLLAVISVFFVYTAPLLYTQLMKLIFQIPEYIRQLQSLIQSALESLNNRVPAEYSAQLQKGIQSISRELIAWLVLKTHSAFRGGIAVIHYITVMLLIPVLAFYLMKDWKKLIGTIESYLPPQNKKNILQQAKKVDQTLASFARGQAFVCFVLAIYYSLVLHILGLDFGLLIGSLIGIVAFIPYVGAILGFTTSAAIAFFQTSPWLFGDTGSLGLFIAVVITFGVGQFIEGFILIPNIVGKSIRLHPLWVMFALFLGGYLFGFAGVLVATPVAGALGVLLRYVLNRYRHTMNTSYYKRTKRHESTT